MKRRIAYLGLIAIAGASIGPRAHAENISPIFGSAKATPLTTAQNRTVVGKAYYADYYGSFGISYADSASLSGQYGDYGTAAAYASYAYNFFQRPRITKASAISARNGS
jgi:hypothetical protein